MGFRDRREAGCRLGRRLAEEPGLRDPGGRAPVVLGLARGGVPVAAEVARALGAELDVLVVRKLGAPDQPEFGFGALGEGGVRIVDGRTVVHLGLSPAQVEAVAAAESAVLVERVARYRAGRPPLDLSGRTVVIVDDGLATGGSARAAIAVVRARGAARVVLAVPVAPADTLSELEGDVEGLVTLEVPRPFLGVGGAYEDFGQTTDAEVISALGASGPSGR
ncbi:MAG: hypothetical protein RLZZ272_479 [Actinomycetota bacterium]